MRGLKTASEVIGCLRDKLSETELTKNITGEIYREGDRPKDSKMEDVVLIHTAGLAGQLQSGVITIHLFVPEPQRGRRTAELERVLTDALLAIKSEDIRWTIEEIPQAVALDSVHQHFIYTKLKYKLFNG